MLTDTAKYRRDLHAVALDCDLAVVGGGLAGVCCAVTAARAGLRVVLVHDRPVLGGNASSEVRLWVLGATSHMANNNRWAREGGVIDEILVENTFRNPEGNPLIFDTVILETVVREPNITLLLNTAVFDVDKDPADADRIAAVRAFCSQNSTLYHVSAPLFCDASGDGIVGFMAGAAFRMGAESRSEFGEKFAPDAEYGELLGHSIYFYTKDAGRPVRFVAPSYALKDITRIPRWRHFNTREYGCQLWWIEYGGRLDTVHETETIKWELWKVVYGVWDHIKNSGQFPEAETLTLEWVGTIPGKRESRRFEGDYMLVQQDLVEQRRHYDAVSFGGWSIDLHPSDGVFSEKPGCNQWHAKGVYQIPYRCMYSRNVKNLFLAGRIISASHVAFGSSRVMATCAHGAQAVGMAAALCRRDGLLPRDLAQPGRIERLQLELLRRGQHIPHVEISDDADLARKARVTASSVLRLAELPLSSSSATAQLDRARAMLVPVRPGRMPRVSFWVESPEPTELIAELRTCSREDSHTPDVTLARRVVHLEPGGQEAIASRAAAAAHQSASAAGSNGNGAGHGAVAVVDRPRAAPAHRQLVALDFDVEIDRPRYVFICLLANAGAAVVLSDARVTGVLSLCHKGNDRVAKGSTQTPPADIGVESFEFWVPERRPRGQNWAMRFDPPLDAYRPENVASGPERPTAQPNAWMADVDDERPWVELTWDGPREVGEVVLSFDADFDHAMESVLMGHPEREMPFCARGYRVLDAAGRVLAECADHHQTRGRVSFPAVRTDRLRIELMPPEGGAPAGLFRVRMYPPGAAVR